MLFNFLQVYCLRCTWNSVVCSFPTTNIIIPKEFRGVLFIPSSVTFANILQKLNSVLCTPCSWTRYQFAQSFTVTLDMFVKCTRKCFVYRITRRSHDELWVKRRSFVYQWQAKSLLKKNIVIEVPEYKNTKVECDFSLLCFKRVGLRSWAYVSRLSRSGRKTRWAPARMR